MIESIYSAFKNSSGVCTDTRKIKSNNLFLALKGDNFNGNDFILSALDSGCSYAIADEGRADFLDNSRIFLVSNGLTVLQELANHHRGKLKIPIIGLTGSNGKTTSKELLKEALSSGYNCYATKGNLNNHIGVPISLLEINDKHEIAIIEMGANHQLEINHLCNIAEPNLGFITNIGLAHLEGFGGEEGVYKGKKELFDYIIAHNGALFINSDDAKIVRASAGYTGTTYGYSTSAMYQGSPSLDEHGQLHVAWKHDGQEQEFKIESKLTGLYNFSNIMAAVAVSRYFGVTPERICRAISNYQPTNNRSQLERTSAGNTLIIDCYNANPNSMLAALQNLGEMSKQPRVAILGDMKELGDRSISEHQRVIKELIENHQDTNVYLVGEAFQSIDQSHFQTFSSTEDLKKYLQKEQLKDSTILLKGSRSMKLETVLELL